MLRILNSCSHKRVYWLILALTTLVLLSISLYMQYVYFLSPCLLCIYERTAVLGIFCSAVIVLISPRSFLRWIGIFLWIYSSYQGIILSWKHISNQTIQTPFASCPVSPAFPSWLNLEQWIPKFFASYSTACSVSYSFLSIDITKWLLLIFSTYFVIALAVLISQWKNPKKRSLFN